MAIKTFIELFDKWHGTNDYIQNMSKTVPGHSAVILSDFIEEQTGRKPSSAIVFNKLQELYG